MAIVTALPKEKLKKVKRVPDLKPGAYADGLPLHEVQYLQCKLILRPNRFTSRKRLFDFAKVLRAPAAEHKVKFSTGPLVNAPLKIREVLFVDTADFRFYNNGFILRRSLVHAGENHRHQPDLGNCFDDRGGRSRGERSGSDVQVSHH